MKYKILHVDDEKGALNSLKWALMDDYELHQAKSGKEALKIIGEREIDIVLLDIMMPEMDGMEVLEKIKEYDFKIDVIMVSAKNEIDTVVKAIHKGAALYIEKPIDPKKLNIAINAVIEKRKLRDHIYWIKEGQKSHLEYCNIITRSLSMKPVVEIVKKLKGKTDIPVLIQGESGTGKELIARALNEQEEMQPRRFMAIDCGALTETLAEDYLFGHVQGAFTDAKTSRPGYFELADGGDVFLDGIDDLSLPLQAKLLRVIQEKKVTRVGATEDIPIQFRLICASNEDLKLKVAAGLFREDLFYRINVLKIDVPNLNQRRGDIPLLADYFMEQLSKGKKRLSHNAVEKLKNMPWPGNIRQLQNKIENVIAICAEEAIEPYHLSASENLGLNQALEKIKNSGLKGTVSDFERNLITEALMKNDWAIVKTADFLKIHRAWLTSKMKVHNIVKPKSKELRDAIRNIWMPPGYDWETWDVQKYVNDTPNKNIWDEIYKMRGFKDEKDAQKHFLKALEQFAKAFQDEKDKTKKEELKRRIHENLKEFIRRIPKEKKDFIEKLKALDIKDYLKQ